MADTKLHLDANAPFKGPAVDSDFRNSSPKRASRHSLPKTTRKSDEKIKTQFQKQEIEKKHFKAAPQPLSQKSSRAIDTSPLPEVAETIAFFERNQHGLPTSPLKPAPRVARTKIQDVESTRTDLPQPLSVDVESDATNSEVYSAMEIELSTATSPPSILDIMPTTTPIAVSWENAAQAIQDFFNDWFIKPFKQLFGLDELTIEEAEVSTPVERFMDKKFDLYMDKLDKELIKIQERLKEMRENSMSDNEMAVYLRTQWIRLVKMHIDHQEEQIEAITEMVTKKQNIIQERQKERIKASASAGEKEAQLKPLEWINSAASTTRIVAACLSGAIFVASMGLAAFTGGVSIAASALAGLGTFSGVVGAIADVVDGGTSIRQANLNYELNVLLGMLQKWQHEDDSNNKEIEEEMQTLSLKLESIQKHWDHLMQVIEENHQLVRQTLR